MNFNLKKSENDYAAFDAKNAELYLGTWGWFGDSVEEVDSKQNYGMLCNIKDASHNKRFVMYTKSFALFKANPSTRQLMTHEQLGEWSGRFGFVIISNMTHNYFSYHTRDAKHRVHPGVRIRPYGSDEIIQATEDIYLRDCRGVLEA